MTKTQQVGVPTNIAVFVGNPVALVRMDIPGWVLWTLCGKRGTDMNL